MEFTIGALAVGRQYRLCDCHFLRLGFCGIFALKSHQEIISFVRGVDYTRSSSFNEVVVTEQIVLSFSLGGKRGGRTLGKTLALICKCRKNMHI
jgi:hypothetical protein